MARQRARHPRPDVSDVPAFDERLLSLITDDDLALYERVTRRAPQPAPPPPPDAVDTTDDDFGDDTDVDADAEESDYRLDVNRVKWQIVDGAGYVRGQRIS